MSGEGYTNAKVEESPDDKEVRLFSKFVLDHKYTAGQMREAYYRLVGVEEEGEPGTEVAAILSKMREMEEKNVPLNRFASLVETKQNYEDAVPAYYDYVETLKISDKEKGVLRSIVDRERNGEVICMIDGETIAGFNVNVKNIGKETAVVLLAQAIEKILERVPQGKRYAFNFTEK